MITFIVGCVVGGIVGGACGFCWAQMISDRWSAIVDTYKATDDENRRTIQAYKHIAQMDLETIENYRRLLAEVEQSAADIPDQYLPSVLEAQGQ